MFLKLLCNPDVCVSLLRQKNLQNLINALILFFSCFLTTFLYVKCLFSILKNV